MGEEKNEKICQAGYFSYVIESELKSVFQIISFK